MLVGVPIVLNHAAPRVMIAGTCDTVSTLFRQRFRWSLGTLQCLWKHRDALGRYGCFGRLMLPAQWLFQVALQALSPLVDLQVLWVLGTTASAWLDRGLHGRDWQPLPEAVAALYQVGFMYAFFVLVELVGALVAFRLDRERLRPLWSLAGQKFVYRQLMYLVLLKSIRTALQGIRAGWGKADRKGTALPGGSPAQGWRGQR